MFALSISNLKRARKFTDIKIEKENLWETFKIGQSIKEKKSGEMKQKGGETEKTKFMNIIQTVVWSIMIYSWKAVCIWQ